MQPLLLTVISNFRFVTPPAAYQSAAGSARQQPVHLDLQQRTASDRSCAMMAPGGWNFQAGKGSATCTSPDGASGFAFFSATLIGRSRVPYFDSAIVPGIHLDYMPPLDALAAFLRSTQTSFNHVILARVADTARAQEASRSIGRLCQWENGIIKCTAKSGVECVALADVLGMSPTNTGQWGLITMLVWCPKTQFGGLYKELLRMAASFSINEQFSKEYIRAGLENLQRLTRETIAHNSRISSEILQDSREFSRELSRRREYSWNQLGDYVRGEQSFVRDTSGQVFKTDTWGLSVSQDGGGSRYIAEGKPFDYPNFDGSKYGLTPVNYEIWKQLHQ